VQKRYSFLTIVLFILGNSINLAEADDASTPPWRSIPLIKDGKISEGWVHVGWGKFVVEDNCLRTECDERGMGLLVYQRERLGNCQIRVVYKPEAPKANSGVCVRIDDGILDWANKESIAIHRDVKGKLSNEMLQKLQAAAEAEEGVWYAVHHGYEVQIMDENDPLHRTGAIYGLAKAAPLPKAHANEWRTMVITLRANLVLVDVDGKRINSFDSESKDVPTRRLWTEPKRDAKRPQAGYIGLQNHDPGEVVRFKEVSVRLLDGAP
jgi:hydrogenase maturation factor